MDKKAVAIFAGGVLAAAVFGACAALVVVYSGLFDAAASTPHPKLVAWATHAAMIHSVRRQAAGIRAPSRFTPEQAREGFREYEAHCVMCHGGPGVDRQPWVRGMNPTPPYLLDASKRWSDAELYWIVRNGVKMTGMPAWGSTERGGELWDIVAFLDRMPTLKRSQYQAMHETAASQVDHSRKSEPLG